VARRARQARCRAGHAALALGSVAATLLAAEAVLRLLPPHSDPGLRALHELRPERPWIYGLRPGAEAIFSTPGAGPVSYRINPDGFRDRRHARAKPAGVYRILVLGDSLAFGYGVAQEAAFPERMERALGPGVEVLNLGVGGYNPYTEAALLADVGLSYEPDLVLVQFCSNDLNDPTLHFDAQTRLHFAAIPDAAFPDPSARGRSSPALLPWLGWCRGLRLCARLDAALLALRTPPDERTQLLALVSHAELPDGAVREWLAARYAEMAAGAASIGASFALLAFPFEAQVESGTGDSLQRELVALGDARGWKTVDLLPAFRAAAARSAEPLFLDAWHPSAAGHRVAAEAILDALRREGLLPGAADPPRRKSGSEAW
jgi:lysophospholipase L1-like esterase